MKQAHPLCLERLYTGSVAKSSSQPGNRYVPKQFYCAFRTSFFFHVSELLAASFSCRSLFQTERLVSRESYRGTRWSTDKILMNWIHVAEDTALRRAPCQLSASHTSAFYKTTAECNLSGNAITLRFRNRLAIKHIVACRAITSQRPRHKQIYRSWYWVMGANKHVSTATNQHAAIEESLETVFSTVVRAEQLRSGRSEYDRPNNCSYNYICMYARTLPPQMLYTAVCYSSKITHKKNVKEICKLFFQIKQQRR
jgi:hypothetical protein